jgi:hypothetical protein
MKPLIFILGGYNVDVRLQPPDPFITTGFIENIPFYDGFAFYHTLVSPKMASEP